MHYTRLAACNSLRVTHDGNCASCLMLETADMSPSFLENSTPILSPLAQKSFPTPYATWIKWGAMRPSRSSDITDVNGVV